MKATILRHNSEREFYIDERCHITEVSVGPLDVQLSIARARVEPGITTQLHALAGIDERYLVVKGRGRLEIAGLAAADIGPGDVALVPAGTAQRVTNVGSSDLVFYCLCTPPWTSEAYVGLEEDAAESGGVNISR